MDYIQNKLEESDFFAQSIELKLNRRLRARQPTLIGISCSLMLRLIMAIFFISLIMRMVSYSDDVALTFDILDGESEDQVVELDLKATVPWIYVSNQISSEYDYQNLYEVEAEVREWDWKKNIIAKTVAKVSAHICTEEDFSYSSDYRNYFKSMVKTFTAINGRLLCFDSDVFANQKLYNGINFTSGRKLVIQIRLKCDGQDSDCKRRAAQIRFMSWILNERFDFEKRGPGVRPLNLQGLFIDRIIPFEDFTFKTTL